MKKILMKLLLELLKDSKRSDRELAKVLDVSQATVSRMRSKLVKDGLVQQFTVIPDLAKMGFEILAISSFKSKRTKEIREKAIKWTMAKPNVLFVARAEGMGKNAVMVSIHKNYTDYSNFLNDIMFESKDIVEDHDTLLISLRGFIAKPFSLKYLAELYEK
ncbi:MAG: Lrp/AsnC family transcriptional regulator [Candidatus Bathyarchaeota archaeon]|nr:Lrp/AsnC family transcriptional regulator [Candidatus Bathyarchaeota archaeon]